MVKVYITEDGGQVEAGTVDLSGKKLTVDVNEGYEEVASSLQDFVCMDSDMNEVTTEDARRWLSLLPSNLSGSYMRAVAVE